MTKKDFILIADILNRMYRSNMIGATVLIRFTNELDVLFPSFNRGKFLDACITRDHGGMVRETDPTPVR